MEGQNAVNNPTNVEQVKTPQNRNQKLESAQEIFRNMCGGRLDIERVVEYMTEKSNASFGDEEERNPVLKFS